MTAPSHHDLTINLRDGKTARGKVVYLQPKAERWREQTAEVNITCSEWLEPYWHAAIYSTGAESFGGQL